jgi:D-glycero-D-manno-heptose 1,7-bisphosphate phosphatase
MYVLPHRHLAKLTQLCELPPLPDDADWNGLDIAYLDRDGVLNIGSENYINSPEELIVLDNAAESVATIRAAGFRICIVTNQSPVGRGHWDHEKLAEINSALQSELLSQHPDAHLDLILYSPYAPWENAWSRKGRPGMLQVGRQILTATNKGIVLTEFDYGPAYTPVDEGNSFMVGDMDADMNAGLSFGIRTFRCNPDVGLYDVLSRVLSFSDRGDNF